MEVKTLMPMAIISQTNTQIVFVDFSSLQVYTMDGKVLESNESKSIVLKMIEQQRNITQATREKLLQDASLNDNAYNEIVKQMKEASNA